MNVYLVDGLRSPFLKAQGRPGPFSASDLSVQVGQSLSARQPFTPDHFDEVIMGCVMPSPKEVNIARVIALRLGCGHGVPGWTVQRNCASGLQAVDCAYKDILLGRARLVLAGGCDAMSHAAVLLNRYMVDWLGAWYKAKGVLSRLRLLGQLRPKFFVPVIALLQGLNDPVVQLSMGQTAENLAHRFGITREQMDRFSYDSHQRLVNAMAQHAYPEIATIYDTQGQYYDHDDGVRPDTTLEKLTALKPIFDKPFGNITAGNSSQVTDGAALLILANEAAVKDYDLPILGRIVDVAWAALDPAQMGLGPVHAATQLLTRHNLALADIDYWEINEAFAAQVLACVEAWKDDSYCRDVLGLEKALGELDLARVNVDGGAIAIGHPIGASGARVALHLLQVLRRHKARYGIATLCIGGGQGGAILIENRE